MKSDTVPFAAANGLAYLGHHIRGVFGKLGICHVTGHKENAGIPVDVLLLNKLFCFR